MIDGHTVLIAHVGFPTTTFKSPMIYNPYFQSIGVNAAVIPMGVQAGNYAESFRSIFRFTNLRGGLITMPFKVATVAMLDEVSTTVRIAGACNAVLRREDGALVGDLFDGEGFTRGMLRHGRSISGASALVVGAGGVGSAIATALAAAGAERITLFDLDHAAMEGLAARLEAHFPLTAFEVGDSDPAPHDVVVNATPLGMEDGDPMPVNMARLRPETFVGEVVMKRTDTAFVAAARARGCATQIGLDMLYEQIPAYLDFFGFPTTTPERLRALALIDD
ncbi:MAG: shikimate dehydrogenase family protein [Beijerinckiaceae bacterium]